MLNVDFLFSFQLYKGRINATSHVIQHPMYGAGHKFRTLHLPVSTTLAEVLDRVSGKFAIVHVLFFKMQFQKNPPQNQKTCMNQVCLTYIFALFIDNCRIWNSGLSCKLLHMPHVFHVKCTFTGQIRFFPYKTLRWGFSFIPFFV